MLSVLTALRCRLMGARDLIIDSVPILAWRRADPDAAFGHAPAQHPRPLLRGFRVHTLLCRGSGLPLFFLLSPANVHDAPFAQPLLEWAVRLYHIRPRDEKRPALLPVGETARFRMKKDLMVLRVPEGDNKEREYEVVSASPVDKAQTVTTKK